MDGAPVLFCSHVAELGGAETVLLDLLGTLDRHRHPPVLACPPGPLAAAAAAIGVPVHELPFAGAGALGKLWRLPRLATAIGRLAAQIGARAAYANSMIAGYALALGSRARPFVWHVHIVTDARVAHLALRAAQRIVVPSHAGAAALPATLRARTRVVPNGVPAKFFAPPGSGLRQRLGVPPDVFLVGMVGRLDPGKGHAVLFAALAELPAAHAVVVGGEAFADVRPDLRGHAAQLATEVASRGLAGRVHFLGHQADVAPLLGQCDAIVVPSVAVESAPRAIAEAQAAAVPVVASRIGGTAELIDDGATGLLVPPAAVPELRAALARLAGSADLRQRLGTAGRAAVAANRSLAAFTHGITAVLDELVRG